MNRFIKLSAIAAAVVVAAPAFAAASMDANLELDTKYGNNSRGMSQGGRVEFNVAGKAGGANGFVAARASFLAKKENGTGDSGAAVDDMWGQIGTSTADVKFGRFEAADLFPLGKDVYVEDNGVAGYRANTLRGRSTNSAAHLALTVNAAPGVSFELGMVETKAAGAKKGVRPAVMFNAGPATVKLGLESGETNGGAKFNGAGGTVGVALAGGTVNFNAASGKVKSTTTTAEVKSSSFGIVGVFGPAGIAYVADKTGSVKENTVYAAYSIPLFGTGATITPAASYSKAKGSTSANSGVAVRVNYAF